MSQSLRCGRGWNVATLAPHETTTQLEHQSRLKCFNHKNDKGGGAGGTSVIFFCWGILGVPLQKEKNPGLGGLLMMDSRNTP